MYVIIPLYDSPKWGNHINLKMVLRSIHLYYPEGQPVIVGALPDWYTGEYMEWAGRDQGDPGRNIMSKIHQGAMWAQDRGEKAIVKFSDDMVLLQPFNDQIHYYNTVDRDHLEKIDHSYATRVKNTISFVEGVYETEFYNYDSHAPMKFAIEAVETGHANYFIQDDQGRFAPLLINSMIANVPANNSRPVNALGNIFMNYTQYTAEGLAETKHSVSEYRNDKFKNYKILNFNRMGLNKNLKRALANHFTFKSPWEK